MALILPTHVTATEVQESSNNEDIIAMITDGKDISGLIFTAEQVVFKYLGLWKYENPLKFVTVPPNTGQTVFNDTDVPWSSTMMATMPNQMKLAVIMVMSNIMIKQVSQFKEVQEEQVGDHKVVFNPTNISQANYKTFITPDVEALLAQYDIKGRFFSIM